MGRTKQPPGSSAKMWVTLIALILGSQSLWAAEPDIACRQYVRHKSTVTVMGADGSNPTVIFEGVKFNPTSTMPSWSPDGEWIALTVKDENRNDAISKVRANGEELIPILCGTGTGPDGLTFHQPRHPHWSPDGEWILVSEENWLGIVRESEQPDPYCFSNLILLYAPSEWDPETATGWWILLGSTPWNFDGSKISFFEVRLTNDDPTNYQLKVLDIEVVAGTPTVIDDYAILLPSDLEQLMLDEPMWGQNGMDWQRGEQGSILLFDTIDNDTEYISWLDLDLDTGAIRDWGNLTEGWSANWSPNNDRIVYNVGGELRVADIGYTPDGAPNIVPGSSRLIYPDRQECLWPDWKRDVLTATCSETEPCDDGNPCTDDICDIGVCEFTYNTGECDDGNPCTDPDVCSDGICGGMVLHDEGNSGCYGWCCDGECWEEASSCELTCGVKRDPCSTDSDCCSGSCHPIKGTCK